MTHKTPTLKKAPKILRMSCETINHLTAAVGTKPKQEKNCDVNFKTLWPWHFFSSQNLSCGFFYDHNATESKTPIIR